MKLELNVYEKGKVIKTYTADDFTLTTGICEDLLKEVDIDKLTSGKLDKTSLGIEIIKLVVKSFPKFKPFLQETFVGLTDEEYKKTSIKEVANVIVSIVQFAVGELYNIGGTSKN